MIAAALALALSAPARAEDAAAVVARALARVDALVASQPGKDARVVAGGDAKAEALFAEIKPLGWRAAEPLGAAAADEARAPKTRLFAIVYLSRLNDPAAYAPLSRAALDARLDPDARLAAAQGLAALDLPPAASRRTFCALITAAETPAALVDQALVVLSRLGCGDPAPLAALARAAGPRPKGAGLERTRRALAAVARSNGADALKALLALADYFPSESDARAAAILELSARRDDLVSALPAPALPWTRAQLRSETARPDATLALIALADAFPKEGTELLRPLNAHPDPEVLAAAAEALARRGDLASLPALEAISSGALKDPRFGPKAGRPDPAVLLSRLDAAIAVLRRARDGAR